MSGELLSLSQTERNSLKWLMFLESYDRISKSYQNAQDRYFLLVEKVEALR